MSLSTGRPACGKPNGYKAEYMFYDLIRRQVQFVGYR